MPHYVKCPRCDLNYIDEEKQEYCDICLAEMKGVRLQFEDLDFDESQDDEMEVCPVCGENMMRAGEEMCEDCRKKQQYNEEEEVDPEKDEEWTKYLEEDPEPLVDVPEDAFAEEFEDEEEEISEESVEPEEEDLDYVSLDEAYAMQDGDDEDDEEEDDDF